MKKFKVRVFYNAWQDKVFELDEYERSIMRDLVHDLDTENINMMIDFYEIEEVKENETH
jgi:hypothetical protein